ncbi:MAG: hypothetical protein H0V70_27665 [Ktedonobacteraceae bacterium]|nr:hypothetical protein [Ktedonobacteraceae bacterium]
MIALIALVLAIGSAVAYPQAKGSARFFCGIVMLASTVGFLYNIVHFAHPGL